MPRSLVVLAMRLVIVGLKVSSSNRVATTYLRLPTNNGHTDYAALADSNKVSS